MNVYHLCVLFARDDGPGPDHIAHILRLSRSSVYGYLREFQSEGKLGMIPKEDQPVNDPNGK